MRINDECESAWVCSSVSLVEWASALMADVERTTGFETLVGLEPAQHVHETRMLLYVLEEMAELPQMPCCGPCCCCANLEKLSCYCFEEASLPRTAGVADIAVDEMAAAVCAD
ncbi:hypothetical protein WICPIJ_009802 [Wickerhamomyces pijperi]|uniref:Uncharacterized protein n=1 Tax=Wickerhamomyces pijperi TaxID=599730 RepID=A0A9P8TC85_WICPI|nr:hypothetical protein WICPIJ_009802 [Wickerhamomyces pijperi]